MKSTFCAIALAIALTWSTSSWAQVVYPARPEIIGNEEIVFDYSQDACYNEDIPDSPAQAFRDADGKIQLLAIHKIAYRMIGDDFNSLHRDCANGPVFTSDESDRPETYNNQEWLIGVYTLDGKTIYSIVHNEYKPEGDANWFFSWYNTLTFAVSRDTGRSYTQPAAPAHFLAGIPYKYAYGKPMAIFGGSKPIYNPNDGYYYALVHLEKYGLQDWGVGVIRTQTLDDPDSWRGWDGTGFNVHFVDPYNETVDDPANHILAPVSRDNIGKMCESLTFNTYFNQFMVVGFHVKYNAHLGRNVAGFYYSLSNDLIHWSAPILVYESPKSGWQAGGVYYPAIIDHSDTSRNFERPGQEAYLYFTRWNSGSFDRDLVRVPIRFKKNVVSSFTVNSIQDREAESEGDGTGHTGYTNSRGEPEVTLRSALAEVNVCPDTNYIFSIYFDIPGTGIHTISVNKFLPELKRPVLIDGYSQPGSSKNTHSFSEGNNAGITIEIDGNGSGGAIGLNLGGGKTKVEGLALYNFGGGIEISGDGGDTIRGCFIGLNANGEAQGDGIGITIENSSGNVIGGENSDGGNVITGQVTIKGNAARENHVWGNYIGTDLTGAKTVGPGTVTLQDGASRNQIGKEGVPNVISGSYRGVEIIGAGTDSNKVANNLIGVDKTGTLPMHTGLLGVFVSNGPQFNQIGGVGQGNVIGSWEGAGVMLFGAGTEFNSVCGNFIGTDTSGTRDFGNGPPAVQIFDQAANNTIGGTNPGEGNVIAHNAGIAVGVEGDAGTGNAILGNSIYENGFGIDLFPWGVTENDSLDADVGPNNYQNYPYLMAAKSDSGRTHIRGNLSSAKNTTYRIEFFSNSKEDNSGFGQGETFIGSTNITTDENGYANLDVTLPVGVVAGKFITSTATDPLNNTSEFSNGIMVSDAQNYPKIAVSPLNLNFTLNPAQMLSDSTVIRNSGTMTLYWQAVAQDPWIRVDVPAGATAPGGQDFLFLTVNPDGLPAGTITGSVVISSNDADNPAVVLQVTMTITGQVQMSVNPEQFSWHLNSGEIGSGTLLISNSGNAAVDYHLSTENEWLTVVPDSGHMESGQTDSIAVRVDASNLLKGDHVSAIHLDFGNPNPSTIIVPVTVTVETAGGGGPVFVIEPDSVIEALPRGGHIRKKMIVRNVGQQELRWSGHIQAGWAVLQPDSGTVAPSEMDSIFVQIDATGMATGDYAAQIDFTTNDPSHSQSSVPIRIHIFEPVAGVAVSPDSFDISLLPDQIAGDTLQIENLSNKNLDWKIEPKESWVHVELLSGSTPPKGIQRVGVTFDSHGKAPGDYFGGLAIHFEDPQNPDRFVAIHLTVTGPLALPQIHVFPERIVKQIASGEVAEDTLRIFNKGSATLSWQLSSSETWLQKSPDGGETQPGDSSLVILAFHGDELSGTGASDTLTVHSNDPGRPVVKIPVTLSLLTSVAEDGKEQVPGNFYLFQNSPNPFNPTTTIRYALPVPGNVEVMVFNFQGGSVKTLMKGKQGIGIHQLVWDGTDARNRVLPTGVYFVHLRVESTKGRFTQTRKMILLH